MQEETRRMGAANYFETPLTVCQSTRHHAADKPQICLQQAFDKRESWISSRR